MGVYGMLGGLAFFFFGISVFSLKNSVFAILDSKTAIIDKICLRYNTDYRLPKVSPMGCKFQILMLSRGKKLILDL